MQNENGHTYSSIEKYASHLLTLTDEFIIFTDPVGKVIEVNPSMEAVCDISSKEQGKNISDFFFTESAQVEGEEKYTPFYIDTDQIEHAGVYKNNLFIRSREENFLPVSIRITIVTDAEKNNIGYLCLATDNSTLLNAESRIERLSRELVQKAYKAGMADIASMVLHNVGNVLNSVLTSAHIIYSTLDNSKLSGLLKANDLLRENLDNVEEFISSNPKGKKLLAYYLSIGRLLKNEKKLVFDHAKRLSVKTDLIKDIVATQQNYAVQTAGNELAQLSYLIDDALKIQENSLARHTIEIEKDIDDLPEVPLQRMKVLHILINLFKNAKEAMNDLIPERRKIKISLKKIGENVELKIKDSGHGITSENLPKIGIHGFTTKQDGHGFGLHSCFRYMDEMGGKITVTSDGEGQGACFCLLFPMTDKSSYSKGAETANP